MALTQVTSIGLKDGEIVNADLHSAASVALSKLADSGALGSAVTATTQSASDDSTKLATTAFVQAAVTSLIDGAPGSLNTLNELAAAINDDSSYATTLTTALATKAVLTGSTNNTIATVTGANALQGESALTFSGGELQINAASPQLRITESDTSTSCRLVMSGGRLYIQIAQSGQGSSTSAGIMYLTGYNNTTASEIHLKANNTYNTGHLHLEDSKVLKIGSSDDFQVEHDGSDTYLGNITGQLVFQNDGNIKFTTKAGGVERVGIYSNRVDIPDTLRLSNGWSDIGSQMCLGCDSSGHTYIAGYNLRINTGNNNSRTTSVYVSAGGALGIGTTSPQQGSHPSIHLHSDQNDDARIAITTPNKASGRIGYYGLSNRFGIDMYNGFQIRDVGDSYATRLFIDSSGNLKIGEETTDFTYKLTVSGNGSVNTGIFMHDGAAGTWFGIQTQAANGLVVLRADARSGNYPPLTFNVGGAERLRIHTKGVLSTDMDDMHGSGHYSRPLLEINSNGTPSQIKITTNIPYSGNTHAHSVRISGFRYGGAEMVDLQIGWHVYANIFYNRAASSSGAWSPTITLAVENNKVVIHLSGPGYWPKMYVESLYQAFGTSDQAKGWSWSDAAISADSNTPNQTVPYKSSFGNGVSITTNGNVNVNNGNLVFAQNKGISFYNHDSGSTVASNLLDDFEEGYHTTTITVNSGSISSYTNRTLRYSKVGRQVTVWGRLHWTASTSGNMGYFRFSLPFTSNSSVEYETSNNMQAIRATSYNQQEGFRTFRVKAGVAQCNMDDNNGTEHGHFGVTNPHINVFLSYSV